MYNTVKLVGDQKLHNVIISSIVPEIQRSCYGELCIEGKHLHRVACAYALSKARSSWQG